MTSKQFVKGEFSLTNTYDHEDAMRIRYVPDVYGKYPDVSKIVIKKEEAEGADSVEEQER